jgi:hypothetical protein
MGCGMSTEDKEGKARNEEIENQLKRDKMMQRNEIKMLLLGELVDYLIIRSVVLTEHCRCW